MASRTSTAGIDSTTCSSCASRTRRPAAPGRRSWSGAPAPWQATSTTRRRVAEPGPRKATGNVVGATCDGAARRSAEPYAEAGERPAVRPEPNLGPGLAARPRLQPPRVLHWAAMNRELPIFTPPVAGHDGHFGHGEGAGLSIAIGGAPTPAATPDGEGTQASRRHPEWLKARIGAGDEYQDLRRLVRGLNLNTVCEEARCPNIGECWDQRTATVMILGDTCTRACGFCAIKTGRPTWFDPDEPRRVAEAVAAMGLEHVVVTSVARDDLPDGGAGVFAETIRAMRATSPGMGIEVLIPDFNGETAPLRSVMEARPDILNHNLE